MHLTAPSVHASVITLRTIRRFNAQAEAKLHEALRPYRTSASVFCFGSFRRAEILPQSDLDVVVRCAVDLRQPISHALQAAGVSLNLDKVDVSYLADFEPLERIAACQSPEAGFLDTRSLFIQPGDEPFAGRLAWCRDFYNSPDVLAVKLIFERYYARAGNDRSVGADINLKYTPGGYRDVMLLDLYGRMRLPRILDPLEPEYLQQFSIVSDDLSWAKNRTAALFRAVNWLLAVKSALLDVFHRTPLRGRAPLNLQTATLLASSGAAARLADFAVVTPTEILAEHARSRRHVNDAVEQLFSLENPFLRDALGERRAIAMLIDQLWRSDPSAAATTRRLLPESTCYPLLASYLFSGAARPADVDELARNHAREAGLRFLNRLLIKHPLTPRSTLRFIAEQNRISLTDEVDARYRDLVQHRLAAA